MRMDIKERWETILREIKARDLKLEIPEVKLAPGESIVSRNKELGYLVLRYKDSQAFIVDVVKNDLRVRVSHGKVPLSEPATPEECYRLAGVVDIYVWNLDALDQEKFMSVFRRIRRIVRKAGFIAIEIPPEGW